MPLVRTIRSRGANIVVEAHGEVLFDPGGPVNGWLGRFTQRAIAGTIKAAPSNKRPRWQHYGAPLKQTIKGSTRVRQGINRFHLYSAVGSSAPHAYYVDQGTGIYNGSGPYKAKILPPWTHGSPSLYEHTWHPPGQSSVGSRTTIMIKGQKGQFYFDKGLAAAFASMRMRSYQVPGEGVSGMSGVLNSAPSGLTNFLGNTPASGAFMSSLAEWREWKREAYDSGRVMGKNYGSGTAEAARRRARVEQSRAQRTINAQWNKIKRAEASRIRSQERRDRIKAAKAKSIQKPKQVKSNQAARRNERARFLAAAIKKYGRNNVELGSLEFEDGYFYITVRITSKRESDGLMRTDFKEIRGRKVE